MKKIVKLAGCLFAAAALAVQPVMGDVVMKYGDETTKSSPYHVYTEPDMTVVDGIPMIKVTSWLNAKYSYGGFVHEYDSAVWDAQTKTLDIYINEKPYHDAAHIRIKADDSYVYYSGDCTNRYYQFSQYPDNNEWKERRTSTSYHCLVPNKIINGSLYMDAKAVDLLLCVEAASWYEEGKSIRVGM